MTTIYFGVHDEKGEILSTGDYIDGLVEDPIGHLGSRVVTSDSPIVIGVHYVADGEIRSFPARPSANHVWDWTALTWVISQAAVQAEMTRQIQKRLDDFARTRNYDGILSACTYATSTMPKFAAEGQYCVNARDATWAAAYAIIAEVLEGQRPVPSSIADFETDLPDLAWPN